MGPGVGYRKTKELFTETCRNFRPLFQLNRKITAGYSDTVVTKKIILFIVVLMTKTVLPVSARTTANI